MNSRMVATAVAAALLTIGCGDGTEETSEIALFRTTNTNYQLIAADTDGQGIKVLAGKAITGSAVPHLFTRPAWSPDGDRIAFAGVASGDPAGPHADIYTMAADGSRQRRITNTDDAFGPAWSADGRTIVFTRVRGEGEARSGALWSIRPDGSHRRELTRRVKRQQDWVGSFAPDGSRVAFTRVTCAPPKRGGCLSVRRTIFLVRTDGSEERQLLGSAADPAFSPDGDRIAFVSERDKNGTLSYGDRKFFANELYLMDASGADSRRLTETRDLNEAQPSWSPDGARLAFQRGRVVDNAEGMSLHQVNPDGTCERKILADARLDTWYASPSWRPGKQRGGGGALRC